MATTPIGSTLKTTSTKRKKRTIPWPVYFIGIAPIIVFLVLWSIWAATGGPERSIFLPTPGEVWTSGFDLVASGTIFIDAASSLRRVLTGVGLAALVGIPLGVLMGVSLTWKRMLSPTLEILRPIPIAAWVPLTIIIFGIGEAPSLFLIFLGALYPILLNTVGGVAQTEPIHKRAAQMLGASQFTMVRRVLIPSALPSILTGIRLSLGIGWWVVILAELMAVRSGLGYRLVLAQQQVSVDVIVVVMIAIGVIGWGLNEIAVRFEKRLLRWMPTD